MPDAVQLRSLSVRISTRHMAAANVSLETISVIHRSWISSRNFRIPYRALVMARIDYKAYAQHGLPNQFMVRQLSALNTRAAPNHINFELVPPALQAHIHFRPGLNIAHATKIT